MKKPAFSPPKPWRRRARGFAAVIAVILTAALVLTAGAYFFLKKDKVYKVGILSGVDFFLPSIDGFKQKMAELGYVEGKNIVYDIQKTNFDPQKEEEVLKKFISDKVDLISVFPTEPALAAKRITKGTNIPVVFGPAIIEGTGLIEDVRAPGANLTGVQWQNTTGTLKNLEILKEIAPNIMRIYCLHDPNYPLTAAIFENLRPAAYEMGLTLVEVAVENPEAIRAELERRSAQKDVGVDAILTIPSILTVSPQAIEAISQFAAFHKLPLDGPSPNAVFENAPDTFESGALAAVLADKILKGTPAGAIPVATADPRLKINLKSAQSLNIQVSESLLERAHKVIR